MISIVANFYKSGPYIKRLVKSVLNQTYEDWELICVNDCSPGNDLEILKELSRLPEMKGRMRIVDLKENVGISRAKHIGISEARGEWVTFIDGDDRLRPRALESMVVPAEENNLDMVIQNCRRVYDLPLLHIPVYHTPLRSNIDEYGKVIGRKAIMERYIRAFFGVNFLSGYAYWAKLYRRDTLAKSEYEIPDFTLYEDIFFVMHAMLVSKRIMFVDYEGYEWRWGGLSTGAARNKKNGLPDFEAFAVAEKFSLFFEMRTAVMEKHGIKDVYVPLLIELRNVLYSALVRTPSNAADVAGHLRSLCAMPGYRELDRLPALAPNRAADEFLLRIINKNYDEAFALTRPEYKKQWLRRLVKRFL